MKILVLSHHLPPRYKSGAELYALRQCLWLREQGHSVRAVAVEDIEARVSRLEVTTEASLGIPVDRLHFNRNSYPNPLAASYNNPEVADWLADTLREFQPDLMLVHACYLLGVGILEAARAQAVPVVLTLHDYWFLCQRITLMRPGGVLCDGKVSAADCALCLAKDSRRYLWADKLSGGLVGQALVAGGRAGKEPFVTLLGGRQKLETLAARRRDLLAALEGVQQIIAPSRFLKNVFVENGFPAHKIHYCGYGLDTEQLVAIKEASRLGQPIQSDRPLQVGYLGQILPHKGLDVLIKAFGYLASDAPLRLTLHGAAGRDPAYDRRLSHLAGSDSRISFAGAYKAADLSGILSGLDVVVVPSIWLENSPLVIMEAQAAGVPVITTNLGGMAELVQHEVNGLLFARKDSRDLAAQLQRLLDEPDLLSRLRTGIAPIKSLDAEFNELWPIYERVIALASAPELALAQETPPQGEKERERAKVL